MTLVPFVTLALLVTLVGTGCLSGPEMSSGRHLVAAPVTETANIILKNLVSECGSSQGNWKEEVTAGCTTIWATQFSYRAGKRRGRQDLLAIGEATADAEGVALKQIALRSFFGKAFTVRNPAVSGVPALCVSGTLGENGSHWFLFDLSLDEIMKKGKEINLDARSDSGIAVLLAETSSLKPDLNAQLLERARFHASRVDESEKPELLAMARAAIALASGDETDIVAAGAVIDRVCTDCKPLPAENPGQKKPLILSLKLAFVHALADMATATGDPRYRQEAAALLGMLFSEAFFDGSFLMHHNSHGERAAFYCSGCNFMALYLADRLYGDTLILDPVPPLPDRPIEGNRLELTLAGDGNPRKAAEGDPDWLIGEDNRVWVIKERVTVMGHGRFHATVDDLGFALDVVFEIASPEEEPPHGKVSYEIEYVSSGKTRCRFSNNAVFSESRSAGVGPIGNSLGGYRWSLLFASSSSESWDLTFVLEGRG
jgi:hypothetical protein